VIIHHAPEVVLPHDARRDVAVRMRAALLSGTRAAERYVHSDGEQLTSQAFRAVNEISSPTSA
jgi:hypothetical protein